MLLLYFESLCKDTKQQVRKDRQDWAENLAALGEIGLQSGQAKDAFANFRQLRCATTLQQSVKSPTSTNIQYQYLIDAATNATPSTTILCDPPSEIEIHRSIARMKNGRAAGICGLSTELLKAGGDCAVSRLTEVIQQAWESGAAPEDWKKGIILPFYKKNKGARSECKIYHGITLLSVPGKVYAHTVFSRVKTYIQSSRRREQVASLPTDPL